MRIENDMMYYSNYEPVDIMIEPPNYHYSEFNRNLSEEQLAQAKKEKEMLQTFLAIPDVRKMLRTDNTEILSINENAAIIERVKSQLVEKKLPLSLLDTVYNYNDYDDTPDVNMKPNKDFPLTSVWTLANSKNSLIYSNLENGQKYWGLINDLQEKKGELLNCKDADFVAKQLEPIQKHITDFEKKNKETMATIKKRTDIFDSYLEKIGLKEEFYAFENSTCAIPALSTPKTKKRKP